MTATREGQTLTGASRLAAYANLVRLPHTVFALPFALVGVVLASYDHPLRLASLGWVVVAFTAARFAAMAFNRIVDLEYDARNPRTAMRELPRGVLTVREARVSVAIAVAAFVIAAGQLNRLCLELSPLAMVWVLGYSYAKRFTRWSHLILGVGLGIAPVGGYLAIAGRWSDPWWMLVSLATAVTAWVAGFDILYALPDATFDRANSLRSIPASLGDARAVIAARILHALAVLSLVVAGLAMHPGGGEGPFYWCGAVIAAAILLYEHSLVKPDDLSRLDAAFFAMNGILSVTFFLFILAERVRPAVQSALNRG